MYYVRLQMLLMRMLKQNHIKLVIILFLNDEVQQTYICILEITICTSLHTVVVIVWYYIPYFKMCILYNLICDINMMQNIKQFFSLDIYVLHKYIYRFSNLRKLLWKLVSPVLAHLSYQQNRTYNYMYIFSEKSEHI